PRPAGGSKSGQWGKFWEHRLRLEGGTPTPGAEQDSGPSVDLAVILVVEAIVVVEKEDRGM
ncbi:hypothetical protein E4U44_003266, partial [Claviceps purpurea]